MKNFSSITGTLARIAAALAVAAAARAGAADLQGKLVLRPVSSWDVASYGLPSSTEYSGGLSTVGVGQAIYLEAEVAIAIPSADVTNVVWTVSQRPAGSVAALQASPLGNNVPVYEPSERLRFQQVGRQLLRADVVGQYTITATIQSASNGSTNVSTKITAGTYMGVETCALCHSGSKHVPDMVTPWQTTGHATKALAAGLDGGYGTHFGVSCLKCHTTGYDANTNAVNGGFDDLAAQYGWTFPTNMVPGNWASMQTNYPEVAALGNVQCESCHGPGSQHAYGLGNTNLITVNSTATTCQQCHDAPTHHYKGTEWLNSRHAVTTRTPSGPNRAACVRCHTAGGFVQYADALNSGVPYTTNNANTVYQPIDCATCHEPHDATNPHQLRTGPTVLMADGVTTVTNAGLGAFCMNCHRSRNGSVTNSIEKYPLLQQTWAGGSAFGVHDNPAGDMLEGVNGWTYGKVIPSSAHAQSVENTCVGCHMQAVAAGDPAFLQAGGHTFSMTYTNGAGATLDKVDVCMQCHGSISSFDMVKVDYNGDGVIEGVQTEVQKLLNTLSTMLPSSTYVASGNYVADGLVKTSVSAKTNWPAKFLKAGYNWQFVNNDHSKGVHNTAYAVGLLKASIADLSGVSVSGGLPDWWATLYFGSPTNSLAAPNANPSGDGVPNWVKYALGIDPWTAGQAVTNGVIWNNVTAIGGETNTVHIYTAAEVAFDTEVGKTYQIQGVSSMSGGWQNIGSPVAGTGSSVSLLTPTRKDVQQYFRVVHTP